MSIDNNRIPWSVWVFVMIVVALIDACAAMNSGENDNRSDRQGSVMSSMEWDTDRMGLDYKSFNLKAPDPTLCRDACSNDPRCKAWTYLKPSPSPSSKPRCWLKNNIPPPEKNTRCVSGIKTSVSEPPRSLD